MSNRYSNFLPFLPIVISAAPVLVGLAQGSGSSRSGSSTADDFLSDDYLAMIAAEQEEQHRIDLIQANQEEARKKLLWAIVIAVLIVVAIVATVLIKRSVA